MKNKKYFLLFMPVVFFGCFFTFSQKVQAALEVSAYHMVTNDTTPLIKGTISGITGNAEVSVTIDGYGTVSTPPITENGNWSVIFNSALDPGYYYTAEIVATDELAEDDSTSAYIYVDEDFPYEIYYTGEGEEDLEFSSITFGEEYSYDSEDGNFSLLFPAGTVVAKTGGGTFDLTDWYAEIVDSNNERIILKLRFGIPDNDLTFSVHDVTITFHVGAEYNGQILNIFSRNDGDNDEGWDPMEIDCTVASGSCSFDIDHASYFAITEYTSIAETEEGENNDEDDESEKAYISSWKASQYKKQTSGSCQDRLRLVIKGKHFDKDAEVRIGDKKAYSIERKSSNKIVARFCMHNLLEVKTGMKRTVKVINPDADEEEADKKINLDDIGYNMSEEDFDTQTTEGIKNIQTALFSLGFLDKQYATGFYGSLTGNAVIEFQKQNGISQTGYVGPLTKAKLEEKLK